VPAVIACRYCCFFEWLIFFVFKHDEKLLDSYTSLIKKDYGEEQQKKLTRTACRQAGKSDELLICYGRYFKLLI